MGDWGYSFGQEAIVTGADAVNSRGTTITTSATANTKGLYSQIVASTSISAERIIIMAGGANAGQIMLIDVAIGAAAAEKDIAPNLHYHLGPTVSRPAAIWEFPIHIPLGTRISARAQSSDTNAQVVRLEVINLDIINSPPLV